VAKTEKQRLAMELGRHILPRLRELKGSFDIPAALPVNKLTALGQDPHETLFQLIMILRLRAALQGRPGWPQTNIAPINALIGDLESEPLQSILKDAVAPLDQVLSQYVQEGRFCGESTPPFLGWFTESLLQQTDQEGRKDKGAYYTPDPLVGFMVRWLHDLCQSELGYRDGLIDSSQDSEDHFALTMIDPAAGTGFFVLELIRFIRDKIDRESWPGYWENKLLPRLFGLELMYGPYLVSLLDFELLCPELAAPTDLFIWGDALKGPEEHSFLSDCTVFIGNPPYAAFGRKNRNPWILRELEDYKKDLSEKKVNLDDDYIKFFRLAHTLLSKKDKGLLCLVTNDSYLEGPTRVRMRQSIADDFQSISVIDLGGNRFQKGASKETVEDENIFAIQCGVAISSFVRKERQADSSLSYKALCGQGSAKLEWLEKSNPGAISWTSFHLIKPSFEFRPMTEAVAAVFEDYQGFTPLSELFELYGSGVKTDRDRLVYDNDYEQLKNRMEGAFSGSLSEADQKLFRVESSSSYDLLSRLKNGTFAEANLTRCLYRPFDVRWLYYARGFTSRPAWSVMQHMAGDNLALLAKRQARDSDYSWFFVSAGLIADGVFAIDNKGRERVFPLTLTSGQSNMRVPEHLSGALTAREFFAYIYGLVHSPNYRQLYKDLLRQQYPRIPIARDITLVKALSGHGEELIKWHTELTIPLGNAFPIHGDRPFKLGRGYPKWQGRRILFSESQFIGGVSQAVWNVFVGGHRVCKKWLKDRKTETFPIALVNQYRSILGSLQRTLQLGDEIDADILRWGGWPDAFSRGEGGRESRGEV
jgi:predicted helicase